MTAALTVYAFTFMRYSLAITPRNYLLFACHFTNAGAQLTQGYRYLQYHHFGGKEKTAGASAIVETAQQAVTKVEDKTKSAVKA
jgi:mitochondrial pyruvate carrier 1